MSKSPKISLNCRRVFYAPEPVKDFLTRQRMKDRIGESDYLRVVLEQHLIEQGVSPLLSTTQPNDNLKGKRAKAQLMTQTVTNDHAEVDEVTHNQLKTLVSGFLGKGLRGLNG